MTSKNYTEKLESDLMLSDMWPLQTGAGYRCSPGLIVTASIMEKSHWSNRAKVLGTDSCQGSVLRLLRLLLFHPEKINIQTSLK